MNAISKETVTRFTTSNNDVISGMYNHTENKVIVWFYNKSVGGAFTTKQKIDFELHNDLFDYVINNF